MVICFVFFIVKKLNQLYFLLLIGSISILFHLSLYTHFYQNLLQFDSAISAGKKIKESNQKSTISYDSNRLDQDWKTKSYSLEFYSENINQICFSIDELSKYRNKNLWIYTSETELLELENKKWVKEKIAYEHFPTSKINISFFIPIKRKLITSKKFLVKI